MKNILKYLKSTWLIWVLTLIILALIYFIFVDPFINETGFKENAFYIRLALLFVAIQTFAVLRMYNAVVGNTRFLIKLYQTLKTLEVDTIKLIRAYEKLKVSLNKLNDQVIKQNKIREK